MMRVFNQLLLILMLILSAGCGQLFYHPSANQFYDPKNYKIDYEQLNFKTDSGEENLWAYHLKPSKDLKLKKSKGVVVYFHGNAQNISAHFLFPAWMTFFGYDVFIFDYQGYGMSEGTANQKNTYHDGLAALKEALNLKKKLEAEKFIVFGHSLGGNIALRSIVDFPEKDQIDRIIISSSFLSYQKMAFSVLTKNWFTYLLSPLGYLLVSDSYSPKDLLGQINSPSIIVHGDQDEVVDAKFSEEIFDKLTSSTKKKLMIVEGGNHGNIFIDHPQVVKNRQLLLDFIEGNAGPQWSIFSAGPSKDKSPPKALK
jgi:alpha-beta hydrolase superfamily lysophospholipase